MRKRSSQIGEGMKFRVLKVSNDALGPRVINKAIIEFEGRKEADHYCHDNTTLTHYYVAYPLENNERVDRRKA